MENYQLFLLGITAGAALAKPLLAQLDHAERAMEPFATDRRMFNFLGHNADPAQAFTPEALRRLRAIKAERDPFGVISSNRPVLQAGTRQVARVPRPR